MEYFKRNIDADLMEWKKNSHHKPLLLRGARQVGKSMSIRHLGESFEYFVEVNFETRRELRQIFVETSDVREIVSRLASILRTPIVEGKTLLFLDEIQACPEALHSLWTFKEEMPELHVAAAGSLLEFALKELPSFGVGRIRSMFMYPFSFDEFLMASGYEQWVLAKKKADYAHPVPQELHTALVQQFRSFLMVGGMPASVAAWVSTHDYLQCADEQEDIRENVSNGSSSEVDYLIAQDMKVVPLEVKSGVTGKMKSLRLFMQRKHCLVGKRCSLENFGVLDFVDSEDSQYPMTQKHIFIYPLYSLSSIRVLSKPVYM